MSGKDMNAGSFRQARLAIMLATAGWDKAARKPLAGDASFRRYERLRRGRDSAVLMDASPPREDVRPFIAVAELLIGAGFSVPRVLAADVEAGFVLLEDLGDDTYTRLLAGGGDEQALYLLATDVLIALQRRISREARAKLPPFDDERMLREVQVPLDWYWPAVMEAPIDDAQRERYLALWRSLLPLRHRLPTGLALFDFHIDNLLLLPGRAGVAACGLLDFQDAVEAPVGFDLMSLLDDARRDLSPALALRLRERYLAAFPQFDRADFALVFALLGAQRHARIIGTFTRLCVRDGKPGYLAHLPRVWRQLEAALAHPALAPLKDWFDRHWPPARRLVPELKARQ